ncbi:hypothetical protein CMI37_23730 [Candidatus Pacearchaeota archaeon]|nr:hypothetical protein [Candidatus Pacearchaeota archaeon]|tara:strand:- start:1163 stop:1648 length:486 start_codon:yes stop_codon:yes gene_type:complete
MNTSVKRVIFSPEEDIKEFFIDEINEAKKEIKLATFWFTWKPIAYALSKALKKGVDIKIILDSRSLEKKQKDVHNEEIETVPYLLEKGFVDRIRIYNGEMLHYKLMLIDGRRVLNGSCNLFNASLNRTEEYCMVTEGEDLYEIFVKQFYKLWKDKSFKPKT